MFARLLFGFHRRHLVLVQKRIAMTLSHSQLKLDQAFNYLEQVLLGKQDKIKLAVTCLLANGHLLIEDLPGMGKTTLSHALADVFGLNYQRSQFTSDMLPADVIGVSIFDQSKQSFTFHQGPIFSQLLLADEINRANPKTQSALLEAMEERQVSVDGTTYPLPRPHFVIATQNPTHQSGTYPLPESQLDRFLMCLEIGYPPAEAEYKLLKGASSRETKIQQPLLSIDDLLDLQKTVHNVHKSDEVIHYVMRLLAYSRSEGQFPNALSPRAGVALMTAAQAFALVSNRDFVTPEDVQAVFPYVAEHRLRAGRGTLLNSTFSQKILETVAVHGAI